MKTTKTNPHAWFFKYITELEGYDKNYEKVIREGVILDFTNGLTGSLQELYTVFPERYRKMKAELLQPKTQTKTDEMDQARKRLIAVLFAFLKKNSNENATMQYVKAVACNAAGVSAFNDIALSKLKSLYRIFGMKNTAGWTELERKLVWSALRKEHKN